MAELTTFHPDHCHELPDKLEYREIKGKLWGKTGVVSANDVSQGSLDNCYFVAGLRTVARYHDNSIKQLIREVEPGVYDVTFLKMARQGRSGRTSKAKKLPTIRVNNFFWIFADDNEPVKKKQKKAAGAKRQAIATDTRESPAYIKSKTDALWPLVLEKAWVAHCQGESYADICAGLWGNCNPGYVAQTLTHKYSGTMMFNIGDYSGKYDKNHELVVACRKAGNKGRPITMGTIDSTAKNKAVFEKMRQEENIKVSARSSAVSSPDPCMH
jgi:hypothetical protein